MSSIALDASTTCIGWSIWEDDNLLAYGKLKPQLDSVESKIWRLRIQNLAPQVNELIKQYRATKAYIEDVPLFEKKGKLTLVQLGATQGSLLGVCGSNGIHDVTFIAPSTWRSNIGLFDGSEEGKERENLKPKSIKMANELFGLSLKCEYTKSGKYSEERSDDDSSDSILLYCSTRDKYKVIKLQKKTLNRKK